MKKLAILPLLLSVCILVPAAVSAQGVLDSNLSHMARRALDRRDFDAFLALYGDESYNAESALGSYIYELEEQGKSPQEILPYYEFNHKKWGVYSFLRSYGSEEDFDKLTLARYLDARDKSLWKNPELCEEILKLAPDDEPGEFEKALEALRKLPDDHGSCELCALSFVRAARAAIHREKDLSAKVALLEEMIERFPDCVNTAIGLVGLAREMYAIPGQREAVWGTIAKYLAAATNHVARFRVLDCAAGLELSPDEKAGTLDFRLKCLEELFTLCGDRDDQQNCLEQVAHSRRFFAARDGAWDGVVEAYMRAALFSPHDYDGWSCATLAIHVLFEQGKGVAAEELALTWLEKSRKDSTILDISATMLREVALELCKTDRARGLEFYRKAAEELPYNSFTAETLSDIATLSEESGDEENMLRHLLKLALLEIPPEDLALDYGPADWKSDACNRLGEYYEEKGDMRSAVKWYRQWKPYGC
jgi:tetratricopeptide (TPR) repeat protein